MIVPHRACLLLCGEQAHHCRNEWQRACQPHGYAWQNASYNLCSRRHCTGVFFRTSTVTTMIKHEQVVWHLTNVLRIRGSRCYVRRRVPVCRLVRVCVCTRPGLQKGAAAATAATTATAHYRHCRHCCCWTPLQIKSLTATLTATHCQGKATWTTHSTPWCCREGQVRPIAGTQPTSTARCTTTRPQQHARGATEWAATRYLCSSVQNQIKCRGLPPLHYAACARSLFSTTMRANLLVL